MGVIILPASGVTERVKGDAPPQRLPQFLPLVSGSSAVIITHIYLGLALALPLWLPPNLSPLLSGPPFFFSNPPFFLNLRPRIPEGLEKEKGQPFPKPKCCLAEIPEWGGASA